MVSGIFFNIEVSCEKKTYILFWNHLLTERPSLCEEYVIHD